MNVWQSPMLSRLSGVVHGFSLRVGGVSRPPYDSLNLGLAVGDRVDDVVVNRQRFFARLSLTGEEIVAGRQVHGNGATVVDRRDAGRGALTLDDAIPGVDGLVTRERGLGLFGCFADCLPVFFATEGGEAVGLAHAGWRGTVSGIVSTVVALFEGLGVATHELRVALGPCIKPCCYPVSPDVQEVFRKTFGPGVLARARSGETSVDLAAANRLTLLRLGLAEKQIDVSAECTACQPTRYFSHRAHRGVTGRMGALIARV